MRRYTLFLTVLLIPAALLLLPGCPAKPVFPGDPPVFFSADPGNSNIYRNTTGALDGLPSADVNEDSGQDREVVEPDVIRRDGDLLYVLNQYRGLTIVDLNSEKVLSRVPTAGYPRDLYLHGDRAYVLTGYAANVVAEGNVLRYDLGARIYSVDVSVASAPAVLGSIDLEGDFVDSRMVGDALYAVCAQFSYVWNDATTDGTTSSNSSQPTKAQTSNSWVTSVNLADPANLKPVDTLQVDGYGTVIQASNQAIFLAASNWETQNTAITYVDISDPAGAIAVRGSVTVPGQVADRYKMDAWNGVLRVVSNTWWPNRETDITTVDLANPDTPVIMGQTRLNASGETLFATRFDGPRAYLVTYFQVDPLFVIDLSNPAAPKVAGELKVPGWSTHIEPRGDRLIALGVDDTEGRKVSVSLFDVADPAAPALLDRATFGDNWSWSSAYSDVKAFTVLDDMLVVPFSGWNDSDGGYDRLQFVAWTRNDLDAKGYADVQGSVLRSFRQDGSYYGVTSDEVAVIDAADLAQPVVTNHISLAEYVADYLPLPTGYGAQIVSRFNKGDSVLETVPGPDAPAVATVALPAGTLVKAFQQDNDVIAVFQGWDAQNNYKGYYNAIRISCIDPAAPRVIWTQTYDVTPWYGGWWWWDGPVTPMMDVAVKDARMAPYYWWGGWSSDSETVMLAGDRLVMQCSRDAYDQIAGPVAATSGLAVADATTGALAGVVGLGYGEVSSLHGVGDKVYVSSKTYVDANLLGKARCAYYLQVFNPATLLMGASVNVPGVFLQKDAAGILLLEDTQYGEDWSVKRVLNTITWDGGEGLVAAVASLDLPASVSTIKARGANVWFTYYADKPGLGVVRIGDGGALALGPKVETGDAWPTLVDAQADSVYINIGWMAVARYDFSGETPLLAEIAPVMASPLGARFSGAAAYFPLGYSGVAVMGL